MITEASRKANKLHIMHAAKLLSKMKGGHEKENAVKDLEKKEERRQMLKEEGFVLAMLWLLLLTLPVALLWGTLRHLLNRLELMLTGKIPYRVHTSTRISTLMHSLRNTVKNTRERIITICGRRS